MWLEQILQANSSLESCDSVTIVSSVVEMPTIILNLL
jgi:recombinational DNA repair protein RecT